MNREYVLQNWIPELQARGYKELLPCPVNLAVQATLAAIQQKDIHDIIQQADTAVLLNCEDDIGQCLLYVLGISEWTAIYNLACRMDGENKNVVFDKIEGYRKGLTEMMALDIKAHGDAKNFTQKIAAAINQEFAIPSSDTEAIELSDNGSNSLASCLLSNPLFNMNLFSEDEKVAANLTIESADCEIQAHSAGLNDGDRFIPVYPLRGIELEVSQVDGMMWKVQNLNQLAPISIDMWKCWASVSDTDIRPCRQNALNARFGAKTHMLSKSWPMNTFAPKYQCHEHGMVKVRLDLETGPERAHNHNSIMWNWHRPFFCCECSVAKRSNCRGEILWFDHGIWYMITHLQAFFPEAKLLQAKFMLLIAFLSTKAKSVVLDHISFMLKRQFMIQACLELYENQHAMILKELGDGATRSKIELLIKPVEFTTLQNSTSGKRKWKADGTLSMEVTNQQKVNTPQRGRGRGILLKNANFGRGYNTPGSGNSRGYKPNTASPKKFYGYRNFNGSPYPNRTLDF